MSLSLSGRNSISNNEASTRANNHSNNAIEMNPLHHFTSSNNNTNKGVNKAHKEIKTKLSKKEIRKLDPKFDKDVWAEEVRTHLAPKILKAHLQGDTVALKPWLGEAVYSKLAADIRTRKHDGIVIDSNILESDENQIIMKFLESGQAVIVVVYMVQQINCIRNRANEIIEVRRGCLWCEKKCL